MSRQGLENSEPVPRLTEPSAPYARASAPPTDHGDDDDGSSGSLQGEEKGSVHGIADEPPAPPFIRGGDVSNGGRPVGGTAPVHRSSQVVAAVSLGGRCV